jgi:hypothetical protein
MDSIKEYNEKNQLVKETLEDGSWSTREYNDQGEELVLKILKVIGILINTIIKEK